MGSFLKGRIHKPFSLFVCIPSPILYVVLYQCHVPEEEPRYTDPCNLGDLKFLSKISYHSGSFGSFHLGVDLS